ncbi:MAG: NAD(P)-dependent oxidoreductase, partial [bacterium]|nr:NAD(P)-dependent oxidoreductase [bacterium]
AAEKGLLIVDTTTARPEDSEAIAAELREKGIGFLDASLSGSSSAVYERNMVAMVGGEKAHFDRALPVLEAFARSCYHLGENGAGARTKLIVNLVLGLNRAALAEGLTLGMKIGMDTKILLEVLKDSAAYSKAMDNRGQRMIDAAYFDNPTSRLKQHHKDVRLMLEQGARWGVPLFFTSVLDQVLCEAEAAGLSDADTGSSIEVLRRAAGIPAL